MKREPILPYLIEAEFDAVNPVQCSAEGMDPQALKDTYGKYTNPEYRCNG